MNTLLHFGPQNIIWCLVFLWSHHSCYGFSNYYTWKNVSGAQEWVLGGARTKGLNLALYKHTLYFLHNDYIAHAHGWFSNALPYADGKIPYMCTTAQAQTRAGNRYTSSMSLCHFSVNEHNFTCNIACRQKVCKVPQPQDMQLSLNLAEWMSVNWGKKHGSLNRKQIHFLWRVWIFHGNEKKEILRELFFFLPIYFYPVGRW